VIWNTLGRTGTLGLQLGSHDVVKPFVEPAR